MAFRNFDPTNLSRRALIRGGGYFAAGAALSSMPLGRAALAEVQQSYSWPSVTAVIEEFVGEGKVASVLAAFGEKSADPYAIARGGLGLGGTAPVDLDSLYRIYSMTKPITGMATMMLIDDGNLGLDQPVAEILPAFANMQVLNDPLGSLEDTVPAERPITIRNLLTHTAGLGYDIVSKGPLLAAYQQNGISGGQLSRFPIPGVPTFDSAPGLEVWADRLATLPLMYQPGTRWSYSVGLDLLGRVIEVVSGQSFGGFLKERMFDPCGMDSTYFQVPQSEAGRLTDNFGILMSALIPVDPGRASIYLDKPPVEWGGSGLVSSPRDFDRFLKMLLGYGMIDGRRVMGELAVRVGTSNLLPETASMEGTWMAGQGMGAGGRVLDGTYGWGGAAGTIAAVDFNNKLRVGMFTQYMPPETLPLRKRFIDAVVQDMGETGREISFG